MAVRRGHSRAGHHGALRARVIETPPEPPPSGYTFPTTAFDFPILPDDGGTAANDGMMNAADYGLVPNSQAAAAANTAALHTMIANNILPATTFSDKTFWFGNGTWWFAGLGTHTRGIIERHDAPNGWSGGIRIQGQSEAGTILRLVDNDPSFQNAADPRFFIYQSQFESAPGGGPHTAQDSTGLEGYAHIIRDITIDLGASNAGAVGINVMMHNIGAIRRVTVQDAVGAGRSANDADRAYCGFAEERTGAGPNHLHRLTVKGCQYGFRIGQVMCGQGIEHLKLVNQGTCGIVNDSNGLFIRGLVSENNVPVAEIQTGHSLNHFNSVAETPFASGPWVHGGTHWFADTCGYLLIVDAVLTGTAGAGSLSAIRNQTAGGKMFLRNVDSPGYARVAEENGVPVAGGTHITEYATPPVQNLWGQTPASLNLEIKDTPAKPYSAASQWTSVTDFGIIISHGGNQGSNTWASLQAAIDNCTTDTLYFPSTRNGRVFFSGSGTIIVRGNVRHIVGLGCEIGATSADQVLTVRFEHPDRPVGQETVTWEDIRLEGTSLSGVYVIDTPRDVVLLDTYGTLKNTVDSTGTFFSEDILGGNPNFDFPQDYYSRQCNADGGNLVQKYSGGDFWCFYLKAEPKSDGAARHLPASWSGRIEIVGGWHSLTAGPSPATSPIFDVNNPTAALDAQLSVEGFATSLGGLSGAFSTYAEETQNGVTRQCVPGGNAFAGPLAPRESHHHLTLYRSKI